MQSSLRDVATGSKQQKKRRGYENAKMYVLYFELSRQIVFDVDLDFA